MRPDLYKVQDRVYGLSPSGRRILVAAPGDELPMDKARELGIVFEKPAAKKPTSRRKGK